MLIKQTMQPWEHYMVGVSIMTLGIIGTFINSILLYRNYCKDSTSKPNSLVANLCITNLGIIFFAFPLSGLASFKLEWIWGDEWCTYYGAVSLLFGFNIMICMMMLVMDIYLQYNYGSYEQYKEKARKLMITWGWVNSAFWSAAPLLGWSKISYEPTKTSCTVDLMHPNSGYFSYIISCFICCYLLPILLMICGRLKPSKDYAPMSNELTRSYKKIIILILLFFVEWSPYSIVYMWPLFSDPNNIPLALSAAAPVFAKLSVVLTPLVFWNEKIPVEEDKDKN